VTNPLASEPTLLNLECRLAALHQDRKFRPGDPWHVLFTPEEIAMMFNKEPADGGR